MTASDAFADAVAAAILRLLTDDPANARKLRAAMLAVSTAATPSVCTKRECAMALGVTTATIDRAVRNGCPMEHVGTLRRFDLAKVRAWFESRGRRTVRPDDEDPINVTTLVERHHARRRRKSA